MPKKTIHYAAGINAACGMETGRYAELSTIGSQITCKACKRSATFRVNHPKLAIVPSGGGRKPMQGVVMRTFNLRLPHELNDWLEQQENMAGTIVQALTELRRKSKS